MQHRFFCSDPINVQTNFRKVDKGEKTNLWNFKPQKKWLCWFYSKSRSIVWLAQISFPVRRVERNMKKGRWREREIYVATDKKKDAKQKFEWNPKSRTWMAIFLKGCLMSSHKTIRMGSLNRHLGFGKRIESTPWICKTVRV